MRVDPATVLSALVAGVGDLFEDVPVADGDPPDVVPVNALGEELGA